MYVNKKTYPSMMKLLKFVLLITPSTANVEWGFSILTLLCTKQMNWLSPKNIDHLMRIILLGPEKIEDTVWENLINKFKGSVANKRFSVGQSMSWRSEGHFEPPGGPGKDAYFYFQEALKMVKIKVDLFYITRL